MQYSCNIRANIPHDLTKVCLVSIDKCGLGYSFLATFVPYLCKILANAARCFQNNEFVKGFLNMFKTFLAPCGELYVVKMSWNGGENMVQRLHSCLAKKYGFQWTPGDIVPCLGHVSPMFLQYAYYNWKEPIFTARFPKCHYPSRIIHHMPP